MKKLIFLLLVLSLTLPTFAQNLNKGKIEQKKYFEKIPYSIKKGMISVKVSINGKDYNFQFDTGAPFGISEKLYRELGSSISENIEISDANGRKENMNIVSVPKLNLGNITFLNTPGMILPKSAMAMYDCHNIDGIIGSNMLRNSIVQFDSRNNEIIITDDANNLAIKNATYQEMTLSKSQSNPFIQVLLKKDDKDANTNVLMDSGSDGFFHIASETYKYFDQQTNVFNKIASNEGSMSWGAFGSESKNQITILDIPKLLFNNTEFNNVVVKTTNSLESRIGNKLFKYGKPTLDYKKKRFYFEPFENSETSEVSQKPWSVNPTFNNGKFIVGIIWDKTLESQINLGDEILSFDEIDYTSISFCDLITSERDSQKSSVIVELKDIKTGKIKNVEIKRLQ